MGVRWRREDSFPAEAGKVGAAPLSNPPEEAGTGVPGVLSEAGGCCRGWGPRWSAVGGTGIGIPGKRAAGDAGGLAIRSRQECRSYGPRMWCYRPEGAIS